MAEDIQWLNAESERDSGSFKFHAVRANLDSKFSELKNIPSVCGLRPKRGWTIDMFADENDRCIKCVRALGLACDTCFGVGYIDTVDRVTKMPNLHRCEICKGTGLK